ncbi:MAG: hypothetical protein JOZ97_04945, partial [Candidatus Eremiobacteraeota bacterium]|nr:hypothetical protein [Candidatus Eremiobacteraeota bacterium]
AEHAGHAVGGPRRTDDHGVALRDAHANPDAHAHAHAHAHAYSDSDSDSDSNTNSDADTNSNTNTDSESNADTNTDANTHTNAVSNTTADPNAAAPASHGESIIAAAVRRSNGPIDNFASGVGNFQRSRLLRLRHLQYHAEYD